MPGRFKDKRTLAIFDDEMVKGIHPNLVYVARLRLQYVYAAKTLEDLRMPSSNCLEKLKGQRKEQWSIRFNRQWRVCFRWDKSMAIDIEFIDYH